MVSGLDAHARPPDSIRTRCKRYQKADLKTISADEDIFDADRNIYAGCIQSSFALPPDLRQVFHRFFVDEQPENVHQTQPSVYEHPHLPGLFIIPSLLPANVQLPLLDKLLHRDLSHLTHKTNLHTHYDIAYPPPSEDGQPSSFFSPAALNTVQAPKDAAVHKPLSMTSCLNRKLRWVTLGGQYDWTQKLYPSTPPPAFPEDVASLVEGLFPTMKAQAAIVNLYTPGDTLSLHRDVSEHCDRPLVSISLGCDGLFIAGLDACEGGEDDTAPSLVMRLHSGDAVVMSGSARYAWHGVPQILSGTCPTWMQDWPAQSGGADQQESDETYEHWRGWMAKKRINLNVRQMWD